MQHRPGLFVVEAGRVHVLKRTFGKTAVVHDRTKRRRDRIVGGHEFKHAAAVRDGDLTRQSRA